MENLDINDFGLQQEYFGFGDDYVQLANSNTEFLNFFEGRKQKKELDAIREDYFKRIDALPNDDEAGRNALFAELEAKLKEKGASNDEINQATKAARGQKIASGVTSALNIFNKAASTLGMGRQIRGEQNIASSGGLKSSAASGGRQGVPMWVWITGGVLVLGLGVFAIIKLKK